VPLVDQTDCVPFLESGSTHSSFHVSNSAINWFKISPAFSSSLIPESESLIASAFWGVPTVALVESALRSVPNSRYQQNIGDTRLEIVQTNRIYSPIIGTCDSFSKYIGHIDIFGVLIQATV
jgi:hypothetical protein